MSRMRNPVICYFVFKNQSHCSGVRGQRVKQGCTFFTVGLFLSRYALHGFLLIACILLKKWQAAVGILQDSAAA